MVRITRSGGDPPDVPLEEVVEALCAHQPRRTGRHAACPQLLPSRDVLVEVVEALRSVLFPGYFGTQDLNAETARYHVGATLDEVSRVLVEQLERGLAYACTAEPRLESRARCRVDAEEVARHFIGRLPEVKRLLDLDVLAAYEGDPAARSPDEAIFCYPGIRAITAHRLAHELYRLDVPLIPRIISEHAHSTTGIDIHPGATIGERFFMDHGTGIVIGETSIIGDRVRVYQGVTLGARSFPLDQEGHPVKGTARHPIVEDEVIVYAGATVLGRVTLGRGSVIGGGVWLTRSVPPGSRISQATSKVELFSDGGGI